MSTQPGLLSLNDDALLSVFSFLYGEDALAVALTSRRLHDLAIPRVTAITACQHRRAFPRLCNYMLHGPQPRARYLEDLDVRRIDLDDTSDTRVPHDRLIADLLTAAQNLRRLALFRLPQSLGQRSRIMEAMFSMRNLVDLHLGDVDEHTLALLPMLSGPLKHLNIWYKHARQSAATDVALLHALTKHARLHSLALRNFMPSEPSLYAPHATSRFSSLRHLSIVTNTAEALRFVSLFPQLSLLALVLDEASVPLAPSDFDTMPRWPLLKDLYAHTELARMQHFVNRVENVVLLRTMMPGEVVTSQVPLAAMLRAASPVRLSLSMWAEESTLNMLGLILATLPRLRTLNLRLQRIRDIADAASEEQWLLSNVRLLKRLRLASLRLIVTFMDLGSFDSPAPPQPEHERRTAAAVPLSVQLVQAMLTLRLLGVVSEFRVSANATPLKEVDPISTDDAADQWYTSPWDRPITRSQYHRRWWCTGEGAGLTEISSKEAEKLMQELERSVISG